MAMFQVQLSVHPTAGGGGLLPPQPLQGLSYHFILVKDGGAGGVIRLEASEALLKQVEKDKACRKLYRQSTGHLQASYPPPKLKQKYRLLPPVLDAHPADAGGGLFEVDDAGNRVVETLQTVRAGFYLIDRRPLTVPPHRPSAAAPGEAAPDVQT